MGRLSAIFVALCMVLIAGSIGAVLYLQFGLSGIESAVVAIAALTGLALFNAVSTRLHDRGDFGGQVGNLARGTADLARQITEINRRVGALEGKTQAAVEKTLAATLPITAEIGEVGGIIKQMAETVAAHDSQLKGLTPSNGALPPAPAMLAAAAAKAPPPRVPLGPLVAALPDEPAAAKPAEAVIPEMTSTETMTETKALESTRTETRLAEAMEMKPVDAKPLEAMPVEAKLADTKPLELKAAEVIKPVDVKPADLRPAEVKPLESNVETQPEIKPVEAPVPSLTLAETASAAAKPAEPQTDEIKPVEPKPEAKPAELKTAATRIATGRFKDLEPAAVIAMIKGAVEANRIDLFLQPIVTLPQRKVRYYEAVARLRVGDGEPVMAADFLAFAEAAGLMPQIDNLMLFRCVQVVRRLLAKNREIGLFCNISTSTLVDAATSQQFTEFMEANKAIAPALVFEFTQAALRAMGSIENESLGALAQLGYRFSLDNVTDLRIEPRDLAERGFRFVKVQAGLLLNRAGAVTDIHPQDFAGLLSRFGVELVAAKIESESAVVDLLDYDVKFGQGFLFSPPRPVRPEVMQGISSDVVAREGGDGAPPAPPAGASSSSTRLSSLAQLARGVVARS